MFFVPDSANGLLVLRIGSFSVSLQSLNIDALNTTSKAMQSEVPDNSYSHYPASQPLMERQITSTSDNQLD